MCKAINFAVCSIYVKPEGQEKCGEMANIYESNKVIQNAQQQVIKITLFITYTM